MFKDLVVVILTAPIWIFALIVALWPVWVTLAAFKLLGWI